MNKSVLEKYLNQQIGFKLDNDQTIYGGMLIAVNEYSAIIEADIGGTKSQAVFDIAKISAIYPNYPIQNIYSYFQPYVPMPSIPPIYPTPQPTPINPYPSPFPWHPDITPWWGTTTIT